MCFSDKNEIKRLSKELPFYNVPILKKIKHLNKLDMLRELLNYNELKIVKTEKKKKKYARRYSIEIIKDKGRNINDPLAQLDASESVIEDFFRDLLIEMKGIRYQITIKVFLSKEKEKGYIIFTTTYFNSSAKTVININKYGLDRSFQQVLYRLDNFINDGPAYRWRIY